MRQVRNVKPRMMNWNNEDSNQMNIVTPEFFNMVRKLLKMLFCRHEYEYIRTLYGDEINAHNGNRKEYRCRKCGMLKWI